MYKNDPDYFWYTNDTSVPCHKASLEARLKFLNINTLLDEKLVDDIRNNYKNMDEKTMIDAVKEHLT